MRIRSAVVTLVLALGACAENDLREKTNLSNSAPSGNAFHMRDYTFDVAVSDADVSVPKIDTSALTDSSTTGKSVAKGIGSGLAAGAATGAGTCFGAGVEGLGENPLLGLGVMIFATPVCAAAWGIVGGVAGGVSKGIESEKHQKARPSRSEVHQLTRLNARPELKANLGLLPGFIATEVDRNTQPELVSQTETRVDDASATSLHPKSRMNLFVTVTRYGFSHTSAGLPLELTADICVQTGGEPKTYIVFDVVARSLPRQGDSWLEMDDVQLVEETRALAGKLVSEFEKRLAQDAYRNLRPTCL